MISGRQVLSSIDQSVSDAHERIEELDNRIESVTGRLAEQEKAVAQDYRELARVRLDHFVDGELEHHLDQTEQQVAALFRQRKKALSTLQGEILAITNRLQSLADDRSAQAAQVDKDAEIVDNAEAETQARLSQDPDYIEQRQKAEDIERQAMHADQKAARNEAERETKGEAYRNDPLFVYLWERNYGLPAYDTSGLFRWLDGKVARLINFADARANYSRLNEIPQRLREHATGIQALAEGEFSALKAIDQKARENDGIPLLEEALEGSQARLDKIDAEITRGESEHQELLSRKAAYAVGEDDYTQRAQVFLASEFKRDDLMELRYDAVNTPFPDDDVIVSRMLERENQRLELEATIQGFKNTIQQHQQRLQELENLRMDFKRQRYDRSGSTFQDNNIIGMVLGQFVAGMLDQGMLWKVLREQQRYRPRRSKPDFGSGGFGRGTVWNGGIGDILDSLGKSSSGFPRGRSGGGGFGRGGGGFRTGGGF